VKLSPIEVGAQEKPYKISVRVLLISCQENSTARNPSRTNKSEQDIKFQSTISAVFVWLLVLLQESEQGSFSLQPTHLTNMTPEAESVRFMKSNSCLDTCIFDLDKELRQTREHRARSRRHYGLKGKSGVPWMPTDLVDHHDENDENAKPSPSSTYCEDEAPLLRLQRKLPARTKGMNEQCVFLERGNNVRSPFLPLLKRQECHRFPLLKRKPSENDTGLATMPPSKRQLILRR
jgi:hypothetical protein